MNSDFTDVNLTENKVSSDSAGGIYVSRVGRNTAAGTIGKIVSMALTFMVTPTLLFYLGPTQFGLYAIIISLQAYIGLLDLGIGSGLSRFMITHQANGDEAGIRRITSFGVLYYLVMATALAPNVYLMAPMCAPLLGASPAFEYQAIFAIYFIFIIFMCSSAAGVISARLYAANRMDLITISNVLATVSFVMSILFVVPRFPYLLSALACSATPILCGLILNLWFLHQSGIKALFANPLALPRSTLKSLFSFGAWSQISNVTAVINLEADKLVISSMLGPATVSPYQIGNSYASLSRALPLTLLGALYPDVTARLARGLAGEQFESFYRDSLRVLMLSTLTVVGFLIAVAPQFLVAWIGHSVSGAQAIAVTLLISYAVNNMTGVGTTIVRAAGRPDIETCYAVTAASLNIGATIILVPRFGLWGVIGGTIIGNVLGSFGFMVFFHLRFRLPFYGTVFSWLLPLIAGVVAASVSTIMLTAVLGWVIEANGRWMQMTIIAASGMAYLLILIILLSALRFWSASDIAAIGTLRAAMHKRQRS